MIPGELSLRRLLAPIQDHLDHPDTTDVVIQEPGKVGVEKAGEWSWHQVDAFTFERLDAISIIAGTMLAKHFDAAHPIVETTLPDRLRFTAIRPPITRDATISIAIRKPRAEVAGLHNQPMTAAHHHNTSADAADAELIALYHAKDWERFFHLAVRARKTIVATGQQGSGKTTFLRKIMQSIPPHDRIVTIEDTEEFHQLPCPNRVALIFGSAGITAERLILTSLRLRADRLAIQELRHEEAYAFLLIHQRGQSGSFATWHAQADDPFTPLRLMVKSHPTGREIPDAELAAMLRNHVDIVAFCRRDHITKEFHTPESVYFRAAENP